jgi:hypothetical protein
MSDHISHEDSELLPGIKGANHGVKEVEPSCLISNVPNGLVISWGLASGAATGAAIIVAAMAAARARYFMNILSC